MFETKKYLNVWNKEIWQNFPLIFHFRWHGGCSFVFSICETIKADLVGVVSDKRETSLEDIFSEKCLYPLPLNPIISLFFPEKPRGKLEHNKRKLTKLRFYSLVPGRNILRWQIATGKICFLRVWFWKVFVFININAKGALAHFPC